MISAKVKGTVEAVIHIFLATKKKKKKNTHSYWEKKNILWYQADCLPSWSSLNNYFIHHFPFPMYISLDFQQYKEFTYHLQLSFWGEKTIVWVGSMESSKKNVY